MGNDLAALTGFEPEQCRLEPVDSSVVCRGCGSGFEAGQEAVRVRGVGLDVDGFYCEGKCTTRAADSYFGD